MAKEMAFLPIFESRLDNDLRPFQSQNMQLKTNRSSDRNCWLILHAMRAIINLIFVLVISLTGGCDFFPEKVSLDDTRVVPLIQAATNFDRSVYGFTQIPTNADVRLENRPGAGYDAMLHFYGATSRTIAFRKLPSGWRWIHEQEIFQGPNLYTNVDGIFHEEIVLTYDIEPVSGYSTNKLHIQYEGEDSRFTSTTNQHDLTLAQAKPILEEWRKKIQK